MTNYLEYGSIAVALLMTLAWIISVFQHDASIVDRFWGLNFVLLAFVYSAVAPTLTWRAMILIVLVTIWGLRLSWHIHSRNRGHAEDIRYKKMRDARGPSFWWLSFFTVFMLQGALALLISAPLLLGISAEQQDPTWIDILAIVLWGVGFYFESFGDRQLKQFRANPANKGKVLRTGLWSLTRHPNYFGDGVIWFSFFVLVVSVPGGWRSFFGPLLMVVFLRYVTGVTMLDKLMLKNKPHYAAYMLSTPAFVPNLYIFALLRFLLLCSIKIGARLFYRFNIEFISPWPADAWKGIRLAVLLNHTSLFEPVIAGVLPFRYLWHITSRGTFPVASETLKSPLAGSIIKLLAPKVIPLSRQRDETWSLFLEATDPNDTMIFIPEGRMKRPNGLDKHGQPMTMRGGIFDVLNQTRNGNMLICYSGGLHHVHAPGQGLPKLFQTIDVKFESLRIETYLAGFSGGTDRKAILADLEHRRDRYTTG